MNICNKEVYNQVLFIYGTDTDCNALFKYILEEERKNKLIFLRNAVYFLIKKS